MLLSWLLAAFIIMPIAELAVLLEVHSHLGLLNTLGIVVFTGVAGALLARAQGLYVMAQIQRDLAAGRMPAPHLMDGLMVLAAGLLLVTPGLITDTAGFLLLVPATRAFIRAWLRARLEARLREGSITVWHW